MNAAIEDIYPLTPMQQGMLFHTLMAPGTGVYVEQLTCRIGRGLDVARFEQALQALVDRHAILRSVFAWDKLNEPLQIARRELRVPLAQLDWRERPAGEREAAYDAFLAEDYQRGFALDQPPLLRFTLIRFGDEDARFVWTSHHILYDGWSFAQLMSEFLAIYVALSRGEASALPPVRPYRDYIAWLKQRDLAKAEAFWRDSLAGFAHPTPLGVDRRREDRAGVEQIIWRYEEAGTARLRDWTRRAGITMNTLVQGVWAILLGRYSRQDDVVFGATVSGRPAEIEGIDSMVGLFINSLPVRARIDRQAMLGDWLRALQAHNAQMRHYEYTPLTQIREWSEVPAGLPLFASMLVFENYPIDASLRQADQILPIGEVRLREQDNYPLTFGASLSSHLEFLVSYDTRHFELATIERLCGHLECLFEAIGADPERRVGELPVLGEAERRAVLRDWNAPFAARPAPDAAATLQDRFEAQAAATPEAPAVIHGDTVLGYAELNARANRVAEALRARGIGPEARVGIGFSRGAAMVAAIYGIWKAGAAYVPFDPDQPAARFALLRDDARLAAMLTEPALAARFDGLPVISLDEAFFAGAEGDAAPAGNPPGRALPGNLAYVIYTSGSTGRPKGTLVSQAATLNMAASHATILANVAPGPLRVACNASLSFDVSVAEMAVLLDGHALVIVPDEVRRAPEALLDFIEAQRIDAIDCPTLQLRYLIESGGTRLPRYVSTGGDAIDAAMWAAAREIDGTRFFNFYGPTECTVDVSVAELHAAGTLPVIGRPQAGSRLYLLDEAMQPVPPGVAGELYVGGANLARGYLGQPAMTAARFVPDPFAAQPGERLYRSGDLARHLADGTLEYVGRADDQLKVRGYRIEPGEVETALLATRPVIEAIVLPQETGPGERQLVAYVGVDPGQEQTRHWGESFDDIYDVEGPADASFNTAGWNSSYDDLPIPAPQMRRWLDSTLARILALNPRHVLELGVGTGMLLHGIAPHCARYYGTDLSARAIAQLDAAVRAAGYRDCEIALLARGAHEIEAWQELGFDTVVINSVAQYFESPDYLLAVIERAVAAIPERGHVFLGDLRHHGLLRAFHTSLELFRAQPSTLLSRLRESVARIEAGETELLVDPAFFFALAERWPAITHVEAMPKAGEDDNELTRFRYDVVLRVDHQRARAGDAAPLVPDWIDWDTALAADQALAELDRRLAAGASPCLAFAGIPDARLEAQVAADAMVHAEAAPRATVAELRRAEAARTRRGIAPAACETLAARHGYRLQLSRAAGALGQFHAVFTREPVRIDWRARFGHDGAAPLVNRPCAVQLLPKIHKQILQALRTRLPDYMIPGRLVVLDRLPRGISGKIDRRALPAPDATANAGLAADAAAQGAALSPTEEILAGIWSEILGVPALGAQDNFFDLGGHSLLATRVISKVRAAFQAELPIRALFEMPTVRGFAQRIELAQRERAGTNLPAITANAAGSTDAAPPLSFAQERLWFIDQLEGPSALYNMPIAVRLSGRLDLDALQRALDTIAGRHATLRTRLAVPEHGPRAEHAQGQPAQLIAPEAGLPIRLVELDTLEREAREARIAELTAEEARTPFDLARGPLARATLLRAGDTEHIALLTLHHTVADGWSIGVLVQELGALYGAFVQGRPSPLPPLELQYADFAAWQRKWQAEGVLQRQLDYWRGALAGAPALLPFPTDHPRAAHRAHRGAHAGFVIDAPLAAAARALGRGTQSTLFMVLMAAFDLLLARYSGESDICVGTVVANRNRAELEPLIGLFANTLVMRAQVDPAASFRALLQRVRGAALEAHANQDLPFEQVVDALAPVRSLSHQPLFQIMLLLQNTPDTALTLPGLSLQSLGAAGTTAKCDLILNVSEAGSELHCDLEYDLNLFEAGTVERIGRHFTQLLRAVTAAPDAPMRGLSLFDAAELRELRQQANATERAWPEPADFISMFEAQARATPGRVAVTGAGRTLDYRELDARADRLAHALAARGIGPEDLVGIHTERDTDMMVAVLGAMKTGAAYVPLDPELRPERLRYMVSDARLAAIVTQRALLAHTPDGADAICLDDAEVEHAPATPFRRARAISPEALAYLIYTSGSTGTPKAVQVRQQSLANLLRSMRQAPGIVADDVMLSVTSLAFDLVVPNLFLPLTCGARTVYAPRELTDDPARLAELMEHHGVSLMQATPATWRMLVEHRWPTLPAPLKLLCGGDALGADLAARLLEHVPAVWNMYGPTETTVWSSFTALERAADAACIGRPLANTRLYVLDEAGQPVPPGAAGELHIGGDGLARGYLHQAAMSAERFVPDPFAGRPGQRMYRTGDLARQLADGQLQLLGRLDNQIKLRGFRIEPGEIEAALAARPGIRECVVLAREFGDGDQRLVAYLVREPAGASALEAGDASHAAPPADTAEALRDALAATLPDYMVPACFVEIEAVPLTANGKLDRRALPLPELSAPAVHVEPATPLQAQIAAIWASLLKRPAIGLHDNFFEAGGHSLLATRLVAHLRRELGVELPLRAVFEAPTLERLARRVQEAGESAAQADTQPAAAPILPRTHREAPPLSAAQHRLWFLEQLQPGNPAYTIPLVVRLSGALDVAAFGRAVNAVVARHATLRTRFAVREGEPVQQIAPALAIEVPLVRLDQEPEARRDARARALIDAAVQLPFDLATGPLLRVSLLRLREDEHIAVAVIHHVVADGWSLDLLVDEIAAGYRAALEGTTPALPALPVQYADYACWQRERREAGVLDAQLRYWLDQLAGAPALLPLPTDRPRPAVQRHLGAALAFEVPGDTAAALDALAARHGATRFMALAAAFDVLLARYSGQADICLGTPIANRRQAELEPLIGLFVNTLVLRNRVDLRAGFDTLLGQVRDTALAAYANQDVPFEQVVEALQVERHLSHTPVFQVMLALQNAPGAELALPGLRLQPLAADTRAAKFDLSLYVSAGAEGLDCLFEYDTDLFDTATVELLARRFVRLLDAVLAQPSRRVGELPLMEREERRRVLEDWNATAVEPRDAGEPALHLRIEQQAARTPEATALVFEGDSLSYGELERRANRLAHALIAAGVRPDQPVALCLERSLEMMVALLGTLKAGAAWLPIDPALPRERIALMLDTARPAAILGHSRLAARLPAHDGLPLLLVDQQPAGAADSPADHSPGLPVHPGQLAYVIFTSGSTGTPKGVGVDHAGIGNRLAWMQRAYPIGAGDRVLQKTPLSFDVSVWELFWPLREGATLVIARPGGHQDPAYLHALIASERISTLHFVPSMLDAFLQARPAGALPALRQVMCSGEALPAALVARFARALPRVALHNLYGPTEASVDVSAWSWPAPEAGSAADAIPAVVPAVIPIGKPIANTRLYVLDEAGQPAPAGVPGELHIAGIGLARGYLNRPALSAERFVPDPFAATPGQRMYRTGDLARHLPDGTLEYLGRIDEQLKLRGLRIEPGEIEAAIARLPGVRETVVVAREFGPGDRRLVAYVTGEGFDAAAAPAALSASLPDYMVPAHFVRLAALPLSAHGKLERRALPAPEARAAEGAGGANGFAAPVTALQRALAAIWADVLKLERVGLDEHFFAAGGHSLLATQLVARIRRDLGLELPLHAIFEAPTLGRLAARIEDAGAGTRLETPVLRAEHFGPPPLSTGQQRLWFLDQLQPGSSAYLIPLALRLSGRLDVEAFRRAVNAVVARHDVLRTTFPMVDGEPVQTVAPRLDIEVPLTALDTLPAEQREARAAELADQAARAPLDLARGPLLRAGLLRLAADRHVAMLTLHHIIADAWSVGVLLNEIAECYQAALEGRPAALPELAIQYTDFAAWQRERLSRGALDTQLDYWVHQLADAPTLLPLPTDHARPPVQRYLGATLDFRVPAETVAALGEIGRRGGATLFMTLTAAFKVLLARHAGQADICVGTPIANRRQAELEPLIGLFINTLVLRDRIELHEGFDALLTRVRDTALAAYARQDVPFEQVVDALQLTRHMSHSVLFQVLVELQNVPLTAAPMPGLEVEPFATPGHAAKFDLTLTMCQVEGGLDCSLTYNTDLFEAATIERMAGHFRRLLAGIVAAPSTRVGALPMLDDAEQRRIVHEWNDNAVDYGNHAQGEGTLHGHFERQAALTPDALAVASPLARLSYGELNARANRLAHHLRRQYGLGAGRLAAICVERSVEMMVGLLAILKTGGAYVPLDPSHPHERLQTMLDDARPAVLLTLARHAGQLPATGVPVCTFDAGLPDEAALPDHDPGLRTYSSELAYVIYTSGSTGKPKGVMISHYTLMQYLRWGQTAYPTERELGSFAQLPLVFDASITTLYIPLLSGKDVHLPPPDAGADLFAFLKEPHDLSVLKITPAHIDLVAASMPKSSVRTRIATTVSGGEALTAAQARVWLDYFPDTTLINEYGPTETTVGCSVQTLRGSVPYEATVPIGWPIANTQMHILDPLGNPVPAGVVGQLYIAGEGLARGYLNRPALSAERFVPNPFSATPGARMYHSGDLARYLPDGTMDFLGRIDDQLKIRGFRIEPGEIESAISGLPGVRDVFVAAWRNPSEAGEQGVALVAYVVPEVQGEGDVSTLRAALREMLPEYMVPAHFVELAHLPLTSNGKVDRRALPAPQPRSRAHGEAAPETPTEIALAAIWENVLRVPGVGRLDSFFDIGGNSLLAVQLVNHAAREFGVALPIRVAFEFQTVAAMAQYVDEITMLQAMSSNHDSLSDDAISMRI
ncbi:non-ribosomal peptide synthase/polyketide synthase [Burkholderia gladioli]|uniref:non-ribosomal peptide synthase/polyketide synthase n=1 Tax=Burkholderia gladioli TaxID=28095 RepID=UPI003EE30C51